MKEQAALSAAEITLDTINDFIADSDEDSVVEELTETSRDYRLMEDKVIKNIAELPFQGENGRPLVEDSFQGENGRPLVPKVNGRHNKHVQHVSLKAEGELLSQGNGIAKMIRANIPIYKEVLPGLESWQASKIASWHNIEGHSILWLFVVCINKRGKCF